jgi:GNAT superfamily N-acetyltransferase
MRLNPSTGTGDIRHGSRGRPQRASHDVGRERPEWSVGAVGIGQFDIEKLRDSSPWALGMIVRRDRRGAGIGRLLLADLERWAPRQGCEQLWVATGGAAVGFYQRCGWRINETVDRDFEPATVLTKKPRAEPM